MSIDACIQEDIARVVKAALQLGTATCWRCAGSGTAPSPIPCVEDALAPEPCNKCEGYGQVVPKWYEAGEAVTGFALGQALQALGRKDYDLAEKWLRAAQEFGLRALDAQTKKNPELLEHGEKYLTLLKDAFER